MKYIGRTLTCVLCSSLFILWLQDSLYCQIHVERGGGNLDRTLERRSKLDSFLRQYRGDTLPELPAAFAMDESVSSRYRKYLEGYYDYRIQGFLHRKAVFEYQFYSSKVIFWLVITMVLCGIVFSGVQFYDGLYRKDRRKKTLPGRKMPLPQEQVTQFEAGAKGIKVSSPILGVIILVISMAFFYLYLVYVYPIQEIM